MPEAVIYGHFQIPSLEGLIKEVAQQLVPTPVRSMVNEDQLRSMLASALPRPTLAENLDFSLPMGCVVTSPKWHDLPLVCAIGYRGGLDGLVQDLGADGYLSGGEGFAAYRIEGQPIYLTAMESHVAVAFAPELTASTRDMLRSQVIEVRPGGADLTGTARLAAIFEDAGDEIRAFSDLANQSSNTPTGSELLDAYRTATADASAEQWKSMGELGRTQLSLDIQPDRVRVMGEHHAQQGTETAKSYAELAGARHDAALTGALPAGSLMAFGMSMDIEGMTRDPMTGAYLEALRTMKGSPAVEAVASMFDRSMTMWAGLGATAAAGAVWIEPKTPGGMVFAYRLGEGVQAMPLMRALLQETSAERKAMLQSFHFKVENNALRVGGVRADVVTIAPKGDVRFPPRFSTLRKALGSKLRLRWAFAQKGDVFYMVMAPKKIERYLKRVLAAAEGKRNLLSRPDVVKMLDAHAQDSALVLVNVGGIVDWLVTLGLVDPLSTPIPGTLGDVTLWGRRPAADRRQLAMDVSQELVDHLLALTM